MSSESALTRWRREIVDGCTIYERPATAEHVAGPPVLFLNGCALAAAGWMPVIDRLPDHDVLAIDRPGFAGTQWPGVLPELPTEVEMMERAIADHPEAVIVAHSMASLGTEAYARLHPDRVAGIVLVDPSVEDYSTRGPVGRFARSTWLPMLHGVTAQAGVARFASWLVHCGFARQSASGRALDRTAFKDPYRDSEALTASAAEWLSYRSQGADLEVLRSVTDIVTTPTSVLAAPPLPDPRRMQILRESFSDLTFNEIGDSKHLMMVDRPDVIAEAVAAVSR